MSRARLCVGALGGALSALAFASELRAAPVFLLDADETTIVDVLEPWTQSSACDCCVCWETALGTIFAYWDDVYYPNVAGPWESLLLYGNGDNAPAFKATTGAIWQMSGLGCDEGASSIPYWSNEARDAAEAYTLSLGYSFSYDVDDWVWFGEDIAAEIDADRPVYYSYWPEGDSAHAVTIVGYDATDETLYIYKNWDPVVTLKGFDDCDGHRTINISPAGEAAVPGEWTCDGSYYEALDGCDCLCGIYDPDCDNSVTAIGCQDGETCNAGGECVGCQDQCPPPAGDRCDGQAAIVACSDTNADGCLELGAPSECASGSVCQDGDCIECTCTDVGARECTDAAHYRICIHVATGCARWSSTSPCPAGETCVADSCQPGAGGSGGAGAGGEPPMGGAAGAPPLASLDPTDDSGCCSVAPGRPDRAPGRGLGALVAGLAALVARRRAARAAASSRQR